MRPKSCFMVMPIKKENSDEHRHYRALYEQFLKPVLESLDYEVTRADEVHKGGAVTKDVIVRLSEADLVIADITGLNPNVFYELGVRHSLRGRGTVIVVDELRTESIPF